jgi:hypothetical protein
MVSSFIVCMVICIAGLLIYALATNKMTTIGLYMFVVGLWFVLWIYTSGHYAIR